ncbi:MAG: A/G-specific adenine glycosylase [Deltaproteobacteria bacterium]|nr:A/G-specific adenine glycosylase [Deltaproteobacteria bacterium]
MSFRSVSFIDIGLIRRRLLRWYDKTGRDLPWRKTRDPYAIWVSETMLQQTQVKTVLPYYRRFLKAVPGIQALDRAPKRKILALWSGLGYYRRAADLKTAARVIVKRYDGKIPVDFDALRKLPGIGSYTAGAIMSIAFNRPYPALDGNSRRVLARLSGVSQDKDLRDVAVRLVSPSRPGHFNQALMDLGATICLPREPKCSSCPVSLHCAAFKSPAFPMTMRSRASSKLRPVQWPLLAVMNGRKVLLRRRPAGALLDSLWEIPGGEKKRGQSVIASLSCHVGDLLEKIGGAAFVGEIRHAITYRDIRAPVFFLAVKDEKKIHLPDRQWRWVSLSSLHRYPLSSLSLKAVKLACRR